MKKIDTERLRLREKLKGSLLEFTKMFYPLLTGRDFIIPSPLGREPHVITICRELTRAFRLEIPSQRLLIAVPPGHGKSTMLTMWVGWTMASYPDSRFMYISYSKSLAAKHTESIKRLISLHEYKYLFDVEIRHDSKAKEFFQTRQGGQVAAFGSAGAIVGVDAGLPGLDRFSGAVIMDDMHKIDEAHSDTIREGVIENYRETIQQRARGINVPFIHIGQRVHEADLAAYLIDGKDGYEWENVTLKAIDEVGNALYPEAFPLEMLKIKEEKDPYVFSSQYQQEPVPAGGALFRPEWFYEMDEDPDILESFVTCDTAETDASWNDASAFSFWGVYEIKRNNIGTGMLGLHWLDCLEIRVEPKDLEMTFLDFYGECNRYKKPPLMAAIEKKSTGVTLVSILSTLQGMQVRQIERNRSSGSKTQRFLDIQSIVASRRVSYTSGARHMPACLQHMSRITANNTHRHDDIADTLADAVKLALIDKTVYSLQESKKNQEAVMSKLGQNLQARLRVGKQRYNGNRS